jgi:hypothetical protein
MDKLLAALKAEDVRTAYAAGAQRGAPQQIMITPGGPSSRRGQESAVVINCAAPNNRSLPHGDRSTIFRPRCECR